MEKKLKDYLHLYIGCDLLADEVYPGFKCKLVPQNNSVSLVNGLSIPDAERYKAKPILRPLSSMKADDIAEWDGNVSIKHTPYCVEIDSCDEFGEFTQIFPDGSILSRSKDDGDIRPINGGLLFRLLLSRGFDMFGLIEAGLAIDATSIPQQEG